MKIKVLPKKERPKVDIERRAKSLSAAYEKGLFSSGINRDLFLDIIQKGNPELKIRTSSVGGVIRTGLWKYNKFVTGITITDFRTDNQGRTFITQLGKIPRFTIMRDEDDMILCRSFISIFNELERKGFKINDKEIPY